MTNSLQDEQEFEAWWSKYQGSTMAHSKYLAKKAWMAARGWGGSVLKPGPRLGVEQEER